MARAARLPAAMVGGLGLLPWVAHGALSRTTRRWFERDIELRERLALASARRSLVRHWSTGATGALPDVLAEITRDERAMAAALAMPAAEQSGRMRAMRALVAHFNVYRWAGRMLVDAAQLRSRERLSDRLSRPAGARRVAPA